MIDRIYTIHPTTTTAPHSQVMTLGENLHIYPDILIGQGLFCSGLPGMGKTSILARILEQVAPFQIPLVCFDLEGDLLSTISHLPRGVLGTAQNCPSARDVLSQGLQVVYDLSSWPTMEERGSFVARMTSSLFQVTQALPASQRVPCFIVLDESSLFLPQRRGLTFSPDVYKALLEAFHCIATMGRKRGLTPLLFTQKIGEIAKTVLAPGNFIIMRQTVHSDLKRCLDYVEKSGVFNYMTDKQLMSYISSLTPGQAIVKLSTGEQKIVSFYERESIHISHTPTTQAALNRYAGKSFNPNMRFGADMEGASAPAPKRAPVSITQAGKSQCKKCGAPATHVVNYSSGRRGYSCAEHASRQCKPL
jgi:hypothetical protein